MFTLRTKFNIAMAYLTKARPYYVQYYILSRCNLNCRMCNIVEGNSDLQDADLKTIAKIADNLRKVGAGVVLLTGGEPFLRRDLPEIVKIFVERDLNPRLQTAGFHTTRDQLEACAKAGAKDINISLASLIPEKQDYINGSIPKSWHRAIESIVNSNDVFSDPDRICAFGTVLSKFNCMEIPAIIELATFLGWYESLVPVHITNLEHPMNFRGIDADFSFSLPADRPALETLRSRIIEMKDRGFNVFDSHAYIDSTFYFLEHNRPNWRHDDVCDSPNLYFAILPNGDFAPCCDHRYPARLSVAADDFPYLYRSPEFKSSVYSIAKACRGCNFGSYPEVTLAVRNAKATLSRARIVLFSKMKRVPKRSLAEVYEFIDHLREKYRIEQCTPAFKLKDGAMSQRYGLPQLVRRPTKDPSGSRKAPKAANTSLDRSTPLSSEAYFPISSSSEHDVSRPMGAVSTTSHVLVTGSSGFIGHAVVLHLLENPDIRITATCRTEDIGRLAALASSRLTIIKNVDLSRTESVRKIPGDLTQVVHAAALAQFKGRSASDLELNNVCATNNLLDHLRRTSIQTLRRFLYVSTIGVHDRPRFYDSSEPIREESTFAPGSKYGLSKLRAERLVRLSALPHAIARLSWIYGPEMRKSSHIRVFSKMCKEGNLVTRLELPGRISVAYIDDVAEVLGCMLLKDKLNYTSYLIASDQPVSYGTVFSTIHKLRGSKSHMIVIPKWIWSLSRLAAPILPLEIRSLVEDYFACNTGRLASEGLRLKTSFEDGIRQSLKLGKWEND